MADKTLNECGEPSPFDPSLNIDPVNPNCEACDIHPSQKDVPFFQDIKKQKIGIGQSGLCDPMQTGQITEDLSKDPQRVDSDKLLDRNVIYRYSKGLRGCDEAVMDLFRDLIVIDEQGSAHPVPIIWASQERAVAAIIQTNVRRDNSLVVDRIKLPILAIYSSDYVFNQSRYIYHHALDYFRYLRKDGKPGFTTNEKFQRDTVFGVARGLPVDIGYQLFAWTFYKEDMNQIVEQVQLKFSPIAYIKVQGVYWETIVKLESVANNENIEPGNTSLRVIKWQFNLKAETFIPQPIVRKKAVLKTRIDIKDSASDLEIADLVARLETVAKELKDD